MQFDKPQVTHDDILEIAKLYGIETMLEVQLLGGVPNVTYKVVDRKKQLALRVGNKGYTTIEHLEIEIEILKHLERTGFAESPRIVDPDNGGHIGYWNSHPVIATTYIDGVTADKLRITSNLCFDVGRVIAYLQRSLILLETYIPPSETFHNRVRKVVTAFSQKAKHLGWAIDVARILRQWEDIEASFLSFSAASVQSIVHTDIWPPNVICKGETIVGVVDFDDWAHGPIILDICAPLIEFALINHTDISPDLTLAILSGYLQHGGQIDLLKEDLIVCCMEMLCLSWLFCNALHKVSYSESETYMHKLEFFRDKHKRKAFELILKDLIQVAKSNRG